MTPGDDMEYDFDLPLKGRMTDSHKWQRYPRDVIPLWVADMDFPCARPIVEALKSRVEQAVFGYSQPSPELRPLIRERLSRLYGWQVSEEEILFIPGVVTGLNLAVRLFSESGDGVVVQPPVYSHFITDPSAHGRVVQEAGLVTSGDTYEIDFDAFSRAFTNRTRLFLLCNPHNPVGRVYRRDELEKLAETCVGRDVLVCSDEIHCDLLFPGSRHIPLASLGKEVAKRAITLMAPSKTFNIAGLGCAFAIIQDPGLRRAWIAGSRGLIPFVNVMGYTAALAGYRDGQEWLDQVLAYLQTNRDFLSTFVRDRMPGLHLSTIEATYLAWLDCRNAGIPGNPFEFFLKKARVALNDGAEFGKGGTGFVRLNFACPRKALLEALERMENALSRR